MYEGKRLCIYVDIYRYMYGCIFAGMNALKYIILITAWYVVKLTHS